MYWKFLPIACLLGLGLLTAQPVLLDEAESFKGWNNAVAVKSPSPVKVGAVSAFWTNSHKGASVILNRMMDWTPYQALSFWLYASNAGDSRFLFRAVATNENKEGDYYSVGPSNITWSGWKQLVIPLAKFSKARNPKGWNAVNKIEFINNGWGMTPSSNATYFIDRVELLVEIPK